MGLCCAVPLFYNLKYSEEEEKVQRIVVFQGHCASIFLLVLLVFPLLLMR